MLLELKGEDLVPLFLKIFTHTRLTYSILIINKTFKYYSSMYIFFTLFNPLSIYSNLSTVFGIHNANVVKTITIKTTTTTKTTKMVII